MAWDGGWPPGSPFAELHDLARTGDEVAIAAILRNNSVDVNERDEVQLSALHWAALSGHARVVEQLCAAGARVNAKDDESGTPAHYAARHGHVDVMRTLHRFGANMSAHDEGRITPAHAAGRAGQVRALLFLEVHCDCDVDDAACGFSPLDLLQRRSDDAGIIAYRAAKQHLRATTERWHNVIIFLLLLVRHAPSNRLRPLDANRPSPLLSSPSIWHDHTWGRILVFIGYSVPLSTAAVAEHRNAQLLRAVADHAQAEADEARRKADAAAEQALWAQHRAQAATHAAEAVSRASVCARFLEEYGEL